MTVSSGKKGSVWECRLWYWSTPALDAEVLARVDAEFEEYERREPSWNRAHEGKPPERPAASQFVRRALGAYLAHRAGGGRAEKEPERDPLDPRTSAVLKCYAHVPLALRAQLVVYLSSTPPRADRVGIHASRKSSVIRQSIRWWLRRNP